MTPHTGPKDRLELSPPKKKKKKESCYEAAAHDCVCTHGYEHNNSKLRAQHEARVVVKRFNKGLRLQRSIR